MIRPSFCACCGRKRGDGRRDRKWLYWVVDVHQRRGNVILGPIGVYVACCPQCWRHDLEPRFDKLATTPTVSL